MTETKPDTLSFLSALRKIGAQNLVAIEPDTGQITAITSGDRESLQSFIDKYNGKRNLYYSVNPPRDAAPNKKLTKNDIEKVEYIYVDLDAPNKADLKPTIKEIAKTKPAFIVDSGGGYNVLWRVDNLSLDDAEAYGRGLVSKYGGDKGVWDTARILRLPGTINIPNAKKKKAGRVRTTAKLIKQNDSLTDPATLAAKTGKAETHFENADFDWQTTIAHADVFDLPEKLKEKITEARLDDKHFAKRFDGDTDGLADPSRSGLAMSIATGLKRNGFTTQDAAKVLYAHSLLYGVEWDQRQMHRILSKATGGKPVGFELSQDQIDLIMAPTSKQAEQRRPSGDLEMIAFKDVKLNTKPKYLIKGVLEKNANAVLYGKSNTGKSFLALDMAAAIAQGVAWAGRKTKPGAVAYFAAEAGRGFGHRMLGVGQKHGLRPSVDNVPIYYCPRPLNLLTGEKVKESMLKAIQNIETETGLKVELAVIDTLARVMPGGNENGSEDMGTVTDNIVWLGYHAKCSTLTVHHSGKSAAAGMRGHSSLQAAIDTELECIRKGDDGASGPGVLKTRKQREQSKDDGDIGFGLRTVALGADDEGDEITSCYAVLDGESEFDAIQEREVENMAKGSIGAQRIIRAYNIARKQLAKIGEDKIHIRALLAGWRVAELGDEALSVPEIKQELSTKFSENGHFQVKTLCPVENDRKRFKRDYGHAADIGVIEEIELDQVVILSPDITGQ